ncbi:unnamed protein product [Rotaria socialis]|uniref:Uncharacterized protein n=1 Tax=Rotaria socialis TaxID=392032 RepID=A0A817RKD3_9BILA|nr:unnamed protein product [Rotaria socialis]CAF3315647.1 unnamed protein product [Rotaria socialis]CAF3609678.1 unnamed protein product [Rotaria socialis]CAF4425536.1 unnamed protein product [Rotaria socialis]CAF4500094.1 unnamed protein product [Rotaria socialis]
MSSFEEEIAGTSRIALKVRDFFETTRTTFQHVRLKFSELESDFGTKFIRKRSAIMPSLVRSPYSEQNSMCNTLEINAKQKNPCLVVIVHLLSTLPEFLRALQQIGRIKIIIFKGPSEDARPEHMR